MAAATFIDVRLVRLTLTPMLHILLFTSLVAQAAKPATPAPPSQPTSVAAASVVYLPPDAAALVVKVSAAAESGRLCQGQLTAARDRLLALEKRELEFQNQQADAAKERDTSADTVRRVPATSGESAAARNLNQAARTQVAEFSEPNREHESRTAAGEGRDHRPPRVPSGQPHGVEAHALRAAERPEVARPPWVVRDRVRRRFRGGATGSSDVLTSATRDIQAMSV